MFWVVLSSLHFSRKPHSLANRREAGDHGNPLNNEGQVLPAPERMSRGLFASHEASGLPQKHKLLTLYNGGPTITQLHYYHDDITVSARLYYSLGGSFMSTLGGSLAR